jgi:cytochrome c biogenesis protein CcmG/thiol:disulfide interchange protein DsbE
MIRKVTIAAGVLSILSIVFLATAQQDNAAKQRKLPAIDLKTMDGKKINSSTFSNNGKPMIITFWATWCKPCIEELNAINESYIDWQKETGVKVIAISIDDAKTSARVAPFVNGKGWPYDVYGDPNGDFKREMGVNNPPHAFLINGKGEIVWQHVGFAEGNEKEMYEMVKLVAAGKPLPSTEKK